MSKSEDNTTRNIITGVGAGLIGLGVAGLTKKRTAAKVLNNKTTKVFNWITDAPSRFTTDRKNIVDHAVGKLLYGDTNFFKARNAKELNKIPKKLHGATYFDLSKTHITKNLPTSDVDLNKNKKIIDDLLQDKIQFSKLKNKGHIPKGDALSKTLKKPKTYNEFLTSISKQENKYIKPANEFASKGKTHISNNDLISIKNKLVSKKLSNKLQQAYKNMDNYVIQDAVDFKTIKIGPSKGQPKTEKRVDILLHKGKASPIKTQSRWITPDVTNKTKLNKEVTNAVNYIVKNNAKLRNATKKDSFVLGVDVIKDKKNKLKIIEMNDQSGFLDPSIVANKTVGRNFRKKVLNMPDRTHLIKGTAAATGAGVLVNNIEN